MRCRARHALTALTGVAALASRLPAQVTWGQAAIHSREQHAMAYDLRRGRVVLFGGLPWGTVTPRDETWEWDGALWTRRNPATSPPGRAGALMAYDARRGVTVLFGGFGSRPLGDTWEWDGTNWAQRSPPQSPPQGSLGDSAMAYGVSRGTVVLYRGGPSTVTPQAETWEWDGSTWTRRAPSVSPSLLRNTAMAYDVLRDRVVLLGCTSPASIVETWEWDGTTWQQRRPASSPPAFPWPAMAYDARRGRAVLFGKASWRAVGETWEWDGTTWQQVLPGASPTGRWLHAMAYDVLRGRTVLFGGSGIRRASTTFGDTWEWDGATWQAVGGTPEGRTEAGFAFDEARGSSVLFGGLGTNWTLLGDTWEWTGRAWIERFPAQSPSRRGRFHLAYDLRRQRAVLFGGVAWSGVSTHVAGDTWEWDGATWTPRSPSLSPSPRSGHAMSYDAARGLVVLFGGADSSGGLRDTWEYDGATWMQRAPAASPPADSSNALAYDERRSRVVLQGGHRQTWEWDGTNRTMRTPAVTAYGVPGPLVYDRWRGRMVWYTEQPTTWEWDATTWIARTPLAPPPLRYERPELTYDPVRRCVVLFGGRGGPWLDETWVYAPVDPASWAPFGAGCAGPAGTPVLAAGAFQLPWLGDPFTLEATMLPAAGAAALAFGLSRTAWGSVALPLDLGALGAPGCLLLTRPDVCVPLAISAGRASSTVLVPYDPSLLGAVFYNQVAASDPRANPLGIVLSNAGAGAFGAK